VRPLFNMGLSQDAEKELRDRALEAIVRIGGAPAVDELEPMLLSIDHTVRDQAANILDRIGWMPDQGREAAAYWLAKRKWDKCIALGEPAADVLAVEIASDDPETRVRAGEALVSIGEPAVDAILRLLGDDDASIRERAAELLDQIGWEPCPDEAGAIYWVTKGCWNQALEIGPSAIRPIVRALRIGDFNTRQAAAYALDSLNWQPTESEDWISFSVMAHHWDTCRKIGGPAVDALITTVLLHDNEDIKREAACVLIDLAESDSLEEEYRERLLSKYDVVVVPYCAGRSFE